MTTKYGVWKNTSLNNSKNLIKIHSLCLYKRTNELCTNPKTWDIMFAHPARSIWFPLLYASLKVRWENSRWLELIILLNFVPKTSYNYSQTNQLIENSQALISLWADQDFDRMNNGLYHWHSYKCFFLSGRNICLGMTKRIGPSTDPCGTSLIIPVQEP